MNRYDESIKFASLSPQQPTTTTTRPSSISFSFSMNFDDNDEPRRAIEHETDDQKLAPSGDLAINANDVLCGRGKTSFNHVGNRRFRSIISESIDDYNSASSRKAKSAVVKKVHDAIRATGGRFLKLDASQRMWVELTQQRSLEKVSHAIRDATSTNENMKKKKKQVHNTIAQVAAHVQSRFPSVHLEGKLDDDDDDDGNGDGDGDGLSGERLAFKSIDSLGLHMSMPTLPGAAAALHVTSGGGGAGGVSSSPPHHFNVRMGDDEDSSSRSAAARLETAATLEERPMPPLHHPNQLRQHHHSSIEERVMPLLHRSTSSSASAPAKLHFAEDMFLQGPVHHSSSSFSSSRRLSSNLLGGTDDDEMPPLRSSLQTTATATTPNPEQQQQQQQQQQQHHHEDDFLSYINEVLGPVSPTDLDIDPLKKLARRKKNDNK